MAATEVIVGGPEVHFAKKLANNDKTARDRAVKRLQMWISKRPGNGGINEVDLLKLWKGLFYCMWFSDKPLIQEELAKVLSKLIHQFSSKENAILFIRTFFKTMGREWHGIDRLRLDKFYQLIRFVLREFLVYLDDHDWNVSTLDMFSTAFIADANNLCADTFSDGIKMFFCEIFVDELQKVLGNSEKTLPDGAAMGLVKPILVMTSKTTCGPLYNSLQTELLRKLLPTNVPNAGGLQEDFNFLKMLNVNYGTVADDVFQLAADESVSSKNRKRLFSVMKRFKEAAAYVPEDDQPGITNYHESRKRDSKEDPVVEPVAKKKKKKKRKDDTEKTEITDKSQSPEGQNSNKKRKKRKSKSESNVSNNDNENNRQDRVDGEAIAVADQVVDNKKKRKTRTKKSVNTEDAEVDSMIENVNALVDTADSELLDVPETQLRTTSIKKAKKTRKERKSVSTTATESSIPTPDATQDSEKTNEGNPESTLVKRVAPTIINDDSTVQISAKPQRRKSTRLEKQKTMLSEVSASQGQLDSIPLPLDTPQAEFVSKPPVRLFVRKSAKKAQEAKEKVSTVRQTSQCKTDPGKKRVKIELSKNTSVVGEQLKFSPVSPFEPSRKPRKSVLKTPVTRSKAEDFF